MKVNDLFNLIYLLNFKVEEIPVKSTRSRKKKKADSEDDTDCPAETVSTN